MNDRSIYKGRFTLYNFCLQLSQAIVAHTIVVIKLVKHVFIQKPTTFFHAASNCRSDL